MFCFNRTNCKPSFLIAVLLPDYEPQINMQWTNQFSVLLWLIIKLQYHIIKLDTVIIQLDQQHSSNSLLACGWWVKVSLNNVVAFFNWLGRQYNHQIKPHSTVVANVLHSG